MEYKINPPINKDNKIFSI